MGDIFRLAEESDTGQLLTLIEGLIERSGT